MTMDQQQPNFINKGLKLSHLRLMVALKETGRVSDAAIRLSISQPAASRLSAEIEKIVGVRLYDRHAQGIVLTEYGLRLAIRSQSVLRGLHEVEREIEELKSGYGGKVSIGSVTGPAVEFLLPAIKQSRLRHPKLEISIVVDTSDILTEQLLTGSLDFVIGRVPVQHELKDFHARVVDSEPVNLIVRKGHQLTRAAKPDLQECVLFDWVFQLEKSLIRKTVEDYLVQRHIALPAKVLSTSSLLLTLVAISQTNAVAPVARSVAEFFKSQDGLGARIEILDVAQDLAVTPYSLIRRRNEELSPASRVLFDLVTRQLEAA